jgi:hypothetical protein
MMVARPVNSSPPGSKSEQQPYFGGSAGHPASRMPFLLPQATVKELGAP